MATIDRIDWHIESVEGDFTEAEQWEVAGAHIGYFMEWAYKKGFAPTDPETCDLEEYQKVKNSEIDGVRFLIENCDTKFWDVDLNEDGKKFAEAAYDKYLEDFCYIVKHEPYDRKYNAEDLNLVFEYLDKAYSDFSNKSA